MSEVFLLSFIPNCSLGDGAAQIEGGSSNLSLPNLETSSWTYPEVCLLVVPDPDNIRYCMIGDLEFLEPSGLEDVGRSISLDLQRG